MNGFIARVSWDSHTDITSKLILPQISNSKTKTIIIKAVKAHRYLVTKWKPMKNLFNGKY